MNHEREFNQIQSSLQYCNDNLNKTKKTEKKISRISSVILHKSIISPRENNHQKKFHSYELLTFIHPNNNSSLTLKTQDNGKKTNRFNILKKNTSAEGMSQIENPSESMIESLSSLIKIIRKTSNKMLRNIKESSMIINRASQFNSRIFDKCNINHQIKRINNIYDSICIINNSDDTIKQSIS